MAEKKLSNIEVWNAKREQGTWVSHVGKQGIHYEFLVPKNRSLRLYYKNALDVRSRKGDNTRRSSNGKIYRPGEFQPVGDKRYFQYYQQKKMSASDYQKWLVVLEQRQRARDQKYIEICKKALGKVV